MKRKSYLLFAAVLVLTVAFTCGCAPEDATTNDTPVAGDEIVVDTNDTVEEDVTVDDTYVEDEYVEEEYVEEEYVDDEYIEYEYVEDEYDYDDDSFYGGMGDDEYDYEEDST